MRAEEIIRFLRNNIEPLTVGPYCGGYRAMGELTDGTTLPCIIAMSEESRVNLALRRFEEARRDLSQFRSMVTSFVAWGNRVSWYELRELSPSPYAIPVSRLNEIGGETSMAWTEFYATMRDGAEFRFGTTFNQEFFEMPAGYAANDIVKIVPAVRNESPRIARIYNDKPIFSCYVPGL